MSTFSFSSLSLPRMANAPQLYRDPFLDQDGAHEGSSAKAEQTPWRPSANAGSFHHSRCRPHGRGIDRDNLAVLQSARKAEREDLESGSIRHQPSSLRGRRPSRGAGIPTLAHSGPHHSDHNELDLRGFHPSHPADGPKGRLYRSGRRIGVLPATGSDSRSPVVGAPCGGFDLDRRRAKPRALREDLPQSRPLCRHLEVDSKDGSTLDLV